ncbi:PQQ-binding-like beta-propeller repeat protein [Pseudooceanicola onchidii]|uniref:PQQ-binding-like beta-propeller repeat protein n=1 Tax=Pseudooceanicola onchidii TaxID=2562279 RepID=UPI0010AAC930|nr:PQQ-binding-like beta-propeller repeat protein [Pseudooceanicola onchidii]
MKPFSKTIAVVAACLSLATGANALSVQPDTRGPDVDAALSPSVLSWILDQGRGGFSFDTFVRQAICRLTVGCGTGDGVAVARSDDLGLIEEAGSTYLFDTATGAMLVRLSLAGDESGLGTDIAVDGDTVALGGSGSVYLFDGKTGAAIGKVSDPEGGSGFGYAVALRGSSLLVGAPNRGGRGYAYLFDTSTGDLVQRLSAPTGVTDFGGDVGFVDGFIAVAGTQPQAGGGSTPGEFLFNPQTGGFVGPASTQQALSAFGGSSSGGSTGTGSTVSNLAAAPVPAVPLPAPLLLLIAALGGLALTRRTFA